MKKVFILNLVLVMLVSFAAISFADVTNANKDHHYFMTLEIQPLPIVLFPTMSIYNINGTIQFAAGNGDIGLSVGSTFVSASSNSLSISGSIFDADLFYRIVPFVNPDKGPLDGFYIGPGIRYESDGATASESVTGQTASGSYSRVGPFVDIGYQWVNNYFAVDLNIGGGYFVYNSITSPFNNYYFRFMFELGFGL